MLNKKIFFAFLLLFNLYLLNQNIFASKPASKSITIKPAMPYALILLQHWGPEDSYTQIHFFNTHVTMEEKVGCTVGLSATKTIKKRLERVEIDSKMKDEFYAIKGKVTTAAQIIQHHSKAVTTWHYYPNGIIKLSQKVK